MSTAETQNLHPDLQQGHSSDISASHSAVVLWLYLCCAMILVMAVIGAITRLTESGLSIMEWAPLSGAIPPLSQTEWERLFSLYKTIPEYQQINRGMELEEFKSIFWWEYFHRLWGRLIGLVFAVPLAVFWIRQQLPGWIKPHLLFLLALGGLQGAIGWYMVASGFADRTDVSQYRLTLHLMMAVGIYCYIFWLALKLGANSTTGASSNALGSWSAILVAAILLTMTSGAFVAGLNAGLIYNTFPLMEGQMIPPSYSDGSPWFINSFENIAAVQFHHRVLATATGLLAIGLGLLVLLKGRSRKVRIAGVLVALASVGQVKLGIMTLLLVVPVGLAAAHQAGALIFLTTALYLLFQLKYSR
ncbi:COX15/CtaA family protein [Kiloniella sp. b19]|uniref:COX15/CtaA family protein n=1 Tax=Kiloniella sp. GXU_MW_B19 TaxID=3141326 RepID=UPI0031E2AF64